MADPGDLSGTTLGPCTITGRLGAGAMGVVYSARHAEHGEVCVKVIGAEHRASGDMLRRFRREAEAARRLRHPHVVRGFGFEQVGEHQLLIQELVNGGDLAGYLARQSGRLPVPEALRIAREVALGLSAAHDAGLVHRDLKPGNVLLHRPGAGGPPIAKLGDLGLVLQVDGEPLDGRTILTKKGAAIGTPYYMAPEQWRGAHEVDARCDLYALGVMLHQLLTGKQPLSGSSITALMKAHVQAPPTPLREHLPEAPAQVEALVLRLLEKDRERRPASAEEVVSEIDRVVAELATLDGTLVPEGAGDSLLGRTVGPVQIVERLGEGAMGVVYRGRHAEHGEVCVKAVSPRHHATGNMLRRFKREAEAARRIRHPHVVAGHGLLEADGHQLLVQELLPGGDLDGLLRESGGRLSVPLALRLAREVALGLEAAHAAGLVHRDLKPANVLLRPEGDPPRPRACIGDLGLVLQVDGEPLDGRTILTGKGQALGTPHYMAPEQWMSAHEVDGRADLYALGVMLYQLIGGKLPFRARSLSAMMRSHLQDAPAPLGPGLPDVPADVDALLGRLLAKGPDDRPRSGGEVAAEIARIAREHGMRDVLLDEPPGPTGADASRLSPAGKPGATSADDPLIGALVDGKYRILSVLGRGGMGVVYEARHELQDQRYALKVIRTGEGAADEELRRRFLREARALGAFTHKAATTLRELGEHDGQLYMAIDFAPGETLGAILKRDGPIGEARARAIAEQVLDCLQAAHESGVVHRDIKPANLIVERRPDGTDRVRVLDFGIAKIVGEAAAARGIAEATLTATGVSIGTPHYMSPEQDAGDPVDARTDIYALGCVLFEAVSGRRPFEADTVQKLKYMIQFEDAPAVAEVASASVSEAFGATIAWALAKKKEDRPASAAEMLGALQGQTRAPAAPPAPPASLAPRARRGVAVVWVLLAIVGLAAAGGAGAWRLGLLPTAGPGASPVSLLAPADGHVTRDGEVTLAGSVSDPSIETVLVGAERVAVRGGGFSHELALPPGSHALEVRAEPAGPVLAALTVHVDDTPPGVRLDSPAPDAVVGDRRVVLRGRAQDRFLESIAVGGAPLALGADGAFEGTVALDDAQGEQSLALVVRDRAGNETTETVRVVLDTVAPTLSVSDPADGSVTRDADVTLRGRVDDANAERVTIEGGEPIPVAADGTFTAPLRLPAEGEHRFVLRAVDRAGNRSEPLAYRLVRDATAAEVVIESPASGTLTGAADVEVRGRVSGEPAVLEVGGARVTPASDGAFSCRVPLVEGDNRIEVFTRDAAGNEGRKSVLVQRDATAPRLAIDAPADGLVTGDQRIEVTGRVEDAHPASVRVATGETTKAVLKDGSFVLAVALAEGENVIALTPRDAAANEGDPVTLRVTRDGTPPRLVLDAADLGPIRIVPLVRGRVIDATPDRVEVVGQTWKAQVKGDGTFELLWPLKEGAGRIELVAIDRAGQRSAPVEVRAVLDTSPPRVAVTNAPSGEVSQPRQIVRGRVTDAAGSPEPGAVLTAGSRELTAASDGTFELVWDLVPGENALTIAARDRAGNTSKAMPLRVSYATFVGAVEDTNPRWGLVLIRLKKGSSVGVGASLALERDGRAIGRVKVAKIAEAESPSNGALISASPEGGLDAGTFEPGDQVRGP